MSAHVDCVPRSSLQAERAPVPHLSPSLFASDCPSDLLVITRTGLGLIDVSDSTVRTILDSQPFIPIEGIINFRAIGGSGTCFKKGIIFRSGEPSKLTEGGAAALRNLGVEVLFDLRSSAEIAKYGSATPSVGGIRVVRCPLTHRDELDPARLAEWSVQNAPRFSKITHISKG